MKRSSWIVLIIFVLTSLCSGDDLDRLARFAKRAYYAASNGKEQFRYSGAVKATPKGKPALTLSIRSLITDGGQVILFLGRLVIKGKVTPATPNSPLPTTLQMVMKHKNTAGGVIRTTTFNTNVQSNGTILQQQLPFQTFDLINPKETLELSVVPLDKNLPAGTISLTTTHLLGAPLSSIWEDKDINVPAASSQLVFIINNFVGEVKKNQLIGPIQLKTPGSPNFFAKGTLRVQGKITIDGNAGLPNTMRITLKHRKQQGNKLLKTEVFNVKVQPDGKVLNQNFPISGATDTETPDVLEVSVQYVDKEMPDRLINLTFAYTEATPI
jgi:hypothetical protein